MYSVPPGTEATPNTTILSANYNAFVEDIETDANAARPVTAGGTGVASALLLSTVNGTASALTPFLKDQGGVNTVSGTNTISVTTAQALAAYGTSAGQIGTGTTLAFVAAATNTSVTVNLDVNTIGNKAIRKIDNTGNEVALIPGDIVKGMLARVRYDSAANSAAGAWILLNPAQEARYPPGHINGLTLSNNASDATNDIDIAVGSARDSTDAANIDLATALTKRLDAAWAVGSSAGMLATGAAVTNTTYYLFLIKRTDTGVVDVAADTSSTGANIAANTNAAYTITRALGHVVRSGGVNGVPVWYGLAIGPNLYVASGKYTPTLTNATNVAASTAAECQYMRVGNVVTVAGSVDIDPTSSTPTTTLMGMSLPVASNFASNGQCGGVAFEIGSGQVAQIRANTTSDYAEFVFSAVSTANRTWSFTFTYLVI